MFERLLDACRRLIIRTALMPTRTPRHRCYLLVVGLGILIAAVLTGCASSRPPSHAPGTAAPDAATQTAKRLRAVTAEWAGTPYVLGGTSRQGIDCSAFVQILYRDVLGVPIPRTTRQQVDAGRTVSVDHAQPGDLLFFRPARKQWHVGVYLGDGEFAHASTSRGVMVSRLEATYWQKAYWMTRRVLPDGPNTAASPLPDPDASSTQRAGW